MGFDNYDNNNMRKTTRENIADRLEYLMNVNHGQRYPNTDFYFHFPIDTNVQIWIMNTSQQHSKTRNGIEPSDTPSLPRKRMSRARTNVKRGKHQKDPECA